MPGQPSQTLAQKVRAKYPGVYDDLTDQALEAAVVAKYPGVYDDVPRTPAVAASAPKATVAGVVTDVGKGIAKGAANTAIGLGGLFYHIPGVRQASDMVQRTVAGDVVPADTLFRGARAAVQPTNAAQRIGYGAEQIGEYFALPLGSGGLVARAPTQGAGSGLLSKVQGASTKEAGVSGLIGAVMPVAGAAATRLVAPLRKGAQTAVVKALGPTKERFKAIAEKVAPDVLKRNLGGWTGTGRAALLDTAKANARAAGKEVDTILQKAGTDVVNTAPIVSALDDAKQAFQTTRRMTADELSGAPDLAKRARQVGDDLFEVDVVIDARPIRQLERLQQIMTNLGPDATVKQLVAVRRVWDRVVDQAGGYAQRAKGAIGVPLKDQAEASVKAEATKAIREVLARDVPDLATVNREYSFWKNLGDVLTQTAKRTAPQRSGIGKTIVTAAGAAAGAASGEGWGDKAENALIYGTLANRLDKVFTSPRWKMATAKWKNSLADAIVSGQIGRINVAVGRVGSALASGAATR